MKSNQNLLNQVIKPENNNNSKSVKDLETALKLGNCTNCNSIKMEFYDSQLTLGEFLSLSPNTNHCLCAIHHRLFNDVHERDTKYFLVFQTGVEINVSKAVFSKSLGKVVCRFGNLYRFQTDAKLRKSIMESRTWKAESLSGVIDTMCSKFSEFLKAFQTLQQIPSFINNTRDEAEKLVDFMKETKTKAANIFEIIKDNFPDLFLPIFNMYCTFQQDLTFLSLTNFLVNLYYLINKLKTLFNHLTDEIVEFDDTFQTQAGESLLLGYLASFLPKELLTALRNMNIFTSKKLLDDSMTLQSFFLLIRKFISAILGCSFVPTIVAQFITDILEYTPLGFKYELYGRMKDMLTDYNFNNRIAFETVTQDKILDIWKLAAAVKFDEVTERDLNKPYLETYKRFEHLVKIVRSYRESVRVEPCCFVFDGPPGCEKTFTMNRLAKIFNEPMYNHTVPPTTLGKDFYDDYQGESIFLADDVGQQGVSQWAPFINMVSSAKLPLPCAEAHLKNTKYFTSKLLLLTTNNLANLTPYRGDGVEDVRALFRRCNIFDFSLVRQEISLDGSKKLNGLVKLRTYNLTHSAYQFGFQETHRRYMENKGIDIPIECDSNNTNNLVIWMYKIIITFLQFKKDVGVTFEAELVDLRNDVVNALDGFPINASDIFRTENRKVIRDELLHHMQEQQDDDPVAVELLNNYDINGGIAQTSWYQNMDATYHHYVGDDMWSMIKTLFLFFIPIAIPLGISMLMKWFTEKPRDVDYVFNNFNCESITRRLDSYVENATSSTDPNALFLKRNVTLSRFSFSRHGEDVLTHCVTTLSGKYLLTILHPFTNYNHNKPIYATVMSDLEKNVICYDHIPVLPVFQDKKDDIIVFALPDRLPTYHCQLSKHIRVEDPDVVSSLITPVKAINLTTHIKPRVEGVYSNTIVGQSRYENSFRADTVFYDVHGDSMCGSLLMDKLGSIIGMHVAGKDSMSLGASMVWSKDTRKSLSELLKNTSLSYNNNESIEQKLNDVSVIKLNNADKIASYVPTQSKIIPSPLKPFLPQTRAPANLQAAGTGTIKELASKSYKHLKEVNSDALAFAIRYVDTIVEDFEPIDMSLVISGDSDMCGLNKDTSGGFGFGPDKSKYVDFENKRLLPEFEVKYEQFMNELITDKLDIKKFLTVDTLKDELRDLGKIDKPRVFKMANLYQTLACKQLFFGLCKNLKNKRHTNGVLVGCNPFIEFQKIYDRAISMGDCVVDGDYKEYDGSMLTQFQMALNSILLGHFKASKEDKVRADTLLNILVMTPTSNMNELLVMTHSLPSGHYLTAVYNSLINKMYGAYAFYIAYVKEHGETNQMVVMKSYIENVMDYVYGDDKLVLCDKRIIHYFNGSALTAAFNEIGLIFTPSDKGEWTYDVRSIGECTLLKRGFKFHPGLARIVPPLSLNTLVGTMSWIGDSTKATEILQDKINNFQREAFLHGDDLFKPLMVKLQLACEQANVSFMELPIRYLFDLYVLQPDLYAKGLISQY